MDKITQDESAFIPMKRYNELLEKEKELSENTTTIRFRPGYIIRQWFDHETRTKYEIILSKDEGSVQIKKIIEELSQNNSKLESEILSRKNDITELQKELLSEKTTSKYYRKKWWFRFFNFFLKLDLHITS